MQVKINEKELNLTKEVGKNLSVIQACEKVNLNLPRFCYYPLLSIAGNCRMCLVEIGNSPKLQVSCALPLMNNMKILTETPAVKKARESILEMILLNHPLDCPVCDQGGECDLQDQSLFYGSDHGRFNEFKRSVESKNFGKSIFPLMNRCIHCTRCIRYSNEIGNESGVGSIGRGSNLEISTYKDYSANIEKGFKGLKKVLPSSGNLIDICPVGALTSKRYSYTARPWELKYLTTYDIWDSSLTKIKVDVTGVKNGKAAILRFQPDGKILPDKLRYSFDGLYNNRLRDCLLNKSSIKKEDGYLLKKDLMQNSYKLWYKLGNSGNGINTTLSIKKSLESTLKKYFLQMENHGLNWQKNLDSSLCFDSKWKEKEKWNHMVWLGIDSKKESEVSEYKLLKLLIPKLTSFGSKVLSKQSILLSHPNLEYTLSSCSTKGLIDFVLKNYDKKAKTFFVLGSSLLNRFDINNLVGLMNEKEIFVLGKGGSLSLVDRLGLNLCNHEENADEVSNLHLVSNENIKRYRDRFSKKMSPKVLISEESYPKRKDLDKKTIHLELALPSLIFESQDSFVDNNGKVKTTPLYYGVGVGNKDEIQKEWIISLDEKLPIKKLKSKKHFVINNSLIESSQRSLIFQDDLSVNSPSLARIYLKDF